MNIIIDILKNYEMYDKKNEINYDAFHLPEKFMDDFSGNIPKNNTLPNNISKNHNGTIILDDIPFITSNKKLSGHNGGKCILMSNGSKFHLKKQSRISIFFDDIMGYNTIENELLINYFLMTINMPCVSYDKALLNNELYLISPWFLKNEESLKTPISNWNSIKTTYKKLTKYNSQIHFLKTVLADRIYGTTDRFPNNFGIIFNDKTKTFRNCPLFDNGGCALSRNQSSFIKINGDNDCNKVINYILSFEEIAFWVKKYMNNHNLTLAAENLKKDKGIIISNSTYNKFDTFFKDSEIIINEELKANGESFKISLT